MSPDEIAAWAGIFAAIFAAAGLFYSGRQTKVSVRSGELDQLMKHKELVDAEYASHTKAFASSDEEQHRLASISLLNLMELFAASVRRKLVHGEAEKFTKDFVVNLLVYLEQSDRAGWLDKPSYPAEFENIRWIRGKNRKTIDLRKKARPTES